MIAIGVILVLGLAAFGICRAYRHWEPDFLVREARAFLAKGDDGSAALEAQRALQLDSANVDACRLVAQSLKAKASPRLFNGDAASCTLRRIPWTIS